MDALSDSSLLSQSEEEPEDDDSDASLIEEIYYTCPWCDDRYKEEESLVKHLKNHVDKLPKGTGGCTKTSAGFQEKSCNNHIPTAWKPYFCEVCSQSFFTQSELQEHAVGHIQQMYTCNRCSRAFRSKTEWTSHLAHHPRNLSLNEYICKNCGKSCFNFTLLKIHIKQCVSASSKVCQSCFEICDGPDHLATHMTTHVQDGSALTGNKLQMTFRCMFCHWDFWSKADLVGHQILRKKDVKFKCSLCAAQFCLRFHLDEHMFWHKKKDPFKCKYCPHEHFETKQQLKDHVESHDLLRPYRCRFCTKCFGLPSSLQIHVKDQHPKERWDSVDKNMHLPKKDNLKHPWHHPNVLFMNESNPETELLQLVQETIQIAETGAKSVSLTPEIGCLTNASQTKQKRFSEKSQKFSGESSSLSCLTSTNLIPLSDKGMDNVNHSGSSMYKPLKQPSFTYSRSSKFSSKKTPYDINLPVMKRPTFDVNQQENGAKSMQIDISGISALQCPQMCTNDSTASLETKFSALLFMILGEETARALGYYDRSVSVTIYDMLQCAGFSVLPPDSKYLTHEELSINIQMLMNLFVKSQITDKYMFSNNSVETLLAEMLWMYMSNPCELQN